MAVSNDSAFHQHKLKLVFENSTCRHEVNNTPLDQRLRNAYDAFDHDYMMINIHEVELEIEYKEEWGRFLKMVQNVRNKRSIRFNTICNKLKYNPAICYQIHNSEDFCYNEIEGLWVVVRGDVWRAINPNIFINSEVDVDKSDAVFLQFEGVHTDDYELCWKSSQSVFHNKCIIEIVYEFVRKRYLSFDETATWLNLLDTGVFGKHFTTIAVIRCNKDENWVPKKHIYYFNPDIIGQLDGILEFDAEGNFKAVPLNPKKSTHALQRTLLLTNEDCEKYCMLVDATDSKPYAVNAVYNSKHRHRCYYRCIVSYLEFRYKEYDQYIGNEIENICVK